MINWRINEDSFEKENITLNGNKFFTGNGYMGIRGTLQEYEKEHFPAINLAGIYDQVGDAWREPLNAPNGLYSYVIFNGVSYRLPETKPEYHHMSLDYRHGVFTRETTWNCGEGRLCVKADRFASLHNKHLITMKYEVFTNTDGELIFITGIDGDVWDINGPHYDEVLLAEDENTISATGITHENKDKVCVLEVCHSNSMADEVIRYKGGKILRVLKQKVKAGSTCTFIKYIGIYTGKDCSNPYEQAKELVVAASGEGYQGIYDRHRKEWDEKWDISEVIIEGDDTAMEALNYSIYHLLSIAPRHSEQLSIAARGLSGQTYKGAVFWDTEMFMLDFFLFTEPQVAKTLLKYRIATLEGAVKKARSYGYQGAFYAWESQEGGFDACSDYNVTDVFTGRKMRTYFKDKQIHISSAVVYGIMRYTEYSGTYDLLIDGGIEVVLECAIFYYDLLLKRVHGDKYELHDVIGPDEYHERVNNNAYTNRMAKYSFESALRIIDLLPDLGDEVLTRVKKIYNCKELYQWFHEAVLKLYIPEPDPKTGIIEQFDGYSNLEDISLADIRKRLLHEKEYWGGAYGIATHTKIIKQADVVTMLQLFSDDYSIDILRKNWDYYEPRTEHGSSLSACMYALLACRCGRADSAYPLFMKSATADLLGKGKEWAGLIYIGGTHPASAGGAYMTAIEGFAGVCQSKGELKANAELPSHWKSMRFHMVYRGEKYKIKLTQGNASIHKVGSNS